MASQHRPFVPENVKMKELTLRAVLLGLVMTVEEVEGSFKLNQHKSDADHTAIASALLQRPDEAAQTIGKQMVALRPQLDYKSPTPVGVAAD